MRASRGTGALIALAVGLAVLSTAATAGEPAEPRVRVVTTGYESELRKTLPVSRGERAGERVVMSLGPGKLGRLRTGDRLRVSAELQVTAPCNTGPRRPDCTGRPWNYDPLVRTRAVLAAGPRVKRGAVIPLGKEVRNRCQQRRPYREHHCVLVLRRALLKVRGPGALPCPPDGCHVNLIASAVHPQARKGDLLPIGGNKPSGRIPQDRGRLNAIVSHGNTRPASRRLRTQRRRRTTSLFDERNRVIYSMRLPALRKGTQLNVNSKLVSSIAGLPFNVRTSTQVLLGDSPRQVDKGGLAKRISSAGGEITETNGYNCTREHDRCLTLKTGVLRIRRDARRHGKPVPLYVNVILINKAKFPGAQPGDRVRIKRSGYLHVSRYSPELRPGG